MRWLITGVAGFIGSRTATQLVKLGHEVTGVDDLSLKDNVPEGIEFFECPVEDWVNGANSYDVILHLAAQTAVTRSLVNPELDFNTNVGGTINMLENTLETSPRALFVNASTNKVYGPNTPSHPVSEAQPIAPETPYGVSKAAAEMYVQEYGRNFGLKTCSLRQSCIYGPDQNGNTDQGWVSHMADCARNKKTFLIYGEGGQVRDLLHVDDLIDLYLLIAEKGVTGTYNVGGGSSNAVTIKGLSRMLGCETAIAGPARPGDQRYYVSNNWKIGCKTGWEPRIHFKDGIRHL